MNSPEPYLGVVASTRNDNHGGDLTHRTQIFVDALVAQATRHRVAAELIIVEWNPPQDRPPLAQELRWPEDNPWCEVRIITVGPHIHRRFGYSDRLPMFQMIAKNVGVRRARAKFVVHTNIDIVFSDAIFAWIARQGLKPGVMYRCDRVDVDRNVPLGVPVTEQLEYCTNHVLRIARKDGNWVVPEGMVPATIANAKCMWWDSPTPQAQPEVAFAAHPDPPRNRALSRLNRAAIPLQKRADRLVASNRISRAKLVELVKVGLYGMAAMGLLCYWIASRLGSLLLGGLVRRLAATWQRLVARSRRSRIYRFATVVLPGARARLRALGYKPTFSELVDELLLKFHRIPQLHTMACGDFMLTDIDSWHRIRGSPELSIYSMYLDALTMITAYKMGLTIQNLPSDRVIYHIDHGGGWTPDNHETLYRRMNHIGVPIISHATYRRYAAHLLTEDSYFLASPNWGLAEQELPERTVTRRIVPAPDASPTQDPVSHGVG